MLAREIQTIGAALDLLEQRHPCLDIHLLELGTKGAQPFGSPLCAITAFESVNLLTSWAWETRVLGRVGSPTTDPRALGPSVPRFPALITEIILSPTWSAPWLPGLFGPVSTFGDQGSKQLLLLALLPHEDPHNLQLRQHLWRVTLLILLPHFQPKLHIGFLRQITRNHLRNPVERGLVVEYIKLSNLFQVIVHFGPFSVQLGKLCAFGFGLVAVLELLYAADQLARELHGLTVLPVKYLPHRLH